MPPTTTLHYLLLAVTALLSPFHHHYVATAAPTPSLLPPLPPPSSSPQHSDHKTTPAGSVIFTVSTNNHSPVHGSPWVDTQTNDVYFTTIEPDNVVGKVNGVTGEVIWLQSQGDGRRGMRDSLTVFDGLVHVGNDNSTFLAFNATDGSLVWSFAVAQRGGCYSATERPCEIYSSPTIDVTLGVRFEGCEDNVTRAMSARTGEILWSTQMEGHVDGTAALDGLGGLLIASDDKHLYRLNATTGEVLWKTAQCGDSQGKPQLNFVTSPGKPIVYYECYVSDGMSSSSVGAVYAADLLTGQQLWVINGAGGLPTFIESLALLVIAGYDGVAYGLDPESGDTRWKQSVSSSQFMSPFVFDSTRSRIYAGDLNGEMFALDAMTGASLWSYQAKDLIANPMGARISADSSMLYFGSYDGYLRALAL